jgi:hypothetical protein
MDGVGGSGLGSAMGTSGTLLFSLFVTSYLLVKQYTKATHFEGAYWGERRGRTRVEKEMRKLAEVQLNTQVDPL